MFNELNSVFVYKYKDGGIFGAKKQKNDNAYELASIQELEGDSEWGLFVIVKEGTFKWDADKKDYIKL